LASIPYPLIVIVDKAFTSRPARDSENGPQIAFFLPGSAPLAVASVASSIKPPSVTARGAGPSASFERDHPLEQTDDD
jgi:hypothetical protein